MSERYPEFATQLRRAMMEAGVAAKVLASAVGVRPQTVSAWRKGESRPDDARLVLVAKRLRVSAESLVADPWTRSERAVLGYESDPVTTLLAELIDEQRRWIVSLAERMEDALAERRRIADAPARWISNEEIDSDMTLMDDVQARVDAAKSPRPKRRKTGT